MHSQMHPNYYSLPIIKELLWSHYCSFLPANISMINYMYIIEYNYGRINNTQRQATELLIVTEVTHHQ